MLILSISATCSGQIKGTIWDTKQIYQTPDYRVLSKDSVLEIIYQGLPYKGRPQSVYAYYASPGTLKGDRSFDKNLPAVVLVHGGGGTAFKKWAILWAQRGYAAIAMDLRGNDAQKKHIEGGFDEPNSLTPYYTITPELNEQWMFQAVANVILAHNLIRSFKEVDPKRTALTGISWGGIISCLLAGVDDRYKAVVPVYGCGYLFESSGMKASLDLLSAADRETWIRQYDPSRYLAKAKMPMLFINGTNDGHFYLDSYTKSYQLSKNRNLSVKIGLKHNHAFGWGNLEIYPFINSYLNGTKSLVKIDKTVLKNGMATASLKTSVPLHKAYLNYTTDPNPVLKDRKWEQTEVKLNNKEISGVLVPEGATIWYFSVTDEDGLQTSGDLQWPKQNNQ
jgi:dienelactone hydrolase